MGWGLLLLQLRLKPMEGEDLERSQHWHTGPVGEGVAVAYLMTEFAEVPAARAGWKPPVVAPVKLVGNQPSGMLVKLTGKSLSDFLHVAGKTCGCMSAYVLHGCPVLLSVSCRSNLPSPPQPSIFTQEPKRAVPASSNVTASPSADKD